MVNFNFCQPCPIDYAFIEKFNTENTPNSLSETVKDAKSVKDSKDADISCDDEKQMEDCNVGSNE